ncbi:MAG: MarR family winged helix-turn-helix transcriptional regulator [Anaerovoracaceae bacterium]
MIKKISDRVAKEANSDLAASGLTLSQLMYLEYIESCGAGPVRLTEFEKHFSSSQPTVSGVVHRLDQKGLVSIAPSPDGGRGKTAQLTDKGKNILSQAVDSRRKTENAILSPLSDEEKASFREYLGRICRYLDSVKEF